MRRIHVHVYEGGQHIGEVSADYVGKETDPERIAEKVSKDLADAGLHAVVRLIPKGER
jgi:hypothetical protein